MISNYHDKIWSRDEVMSSHCPIPSSNGVYFWWFKSIPPLVPTEGCVCFNGLTLLYVGISPDKKGKPNSKSNLRKRIKMHYGGNAEGSTLRKSLGILLYPESKFPLRRVGSGNRLTFTHPGEQWLDQWMRSNAFVSWIQHNEPWILEDELITSLSLPLNIRNNTHSFTPELSKIRTAANKMARDMDIADESGLTRKICLL